MHDAAVKTDLQMLRRGMPMATLLDHRLVLICAILASKLSEQSTYHNTNIMKFNLAFTAPINPPSASPVLSHAQVWAGLVKKIQKPQDFVPLISDCEILEEYDGGLKRVVTFKPGMGPPSGKTTEIITYHGQTTVRNFRTAASNSLLWLKLRPTGRFSHDRRWKLHHEYDISRSRTK